MRIKTSQKIQDEMQKKYPGVNAGLFIGDLFSKIIQTTLSNSSSTITGLGRFISFVTFSKRIGKNVIRFKFKPSTSLLNSIKDDEFLLENLPVKSATVFGKSNLEKCNTDESQEAKKHNKMAEQQTIKRGIKDVNLYNHIIDMIE